MLLGSAELQQGSRYGVLVGQGWGTSLLQVTLAVVGSELFHLVQTLFPSDFPGCVGAWSGPAMGRSGWCFFRSLPNLWDRGRGWGLSLGQFGGVKAVLGRMAALTRVGKWE